MLFRSGWNLNFIRKMIIQAMTARFRKISTPKQSSFRSDKINTAGYWSEDGARAAVQVAAGYGIAFGSWYVSVIILGDV